MINQRQQGRRRGRGGQRPQNNGGRGQDNGNRIDNRARGNAAQLLEKYKTLARDAQQGGDRVLTEYYLQFADHYFRVLADNRARFEEQQPRRDGRDNRYEGDQSGYDPTDGDDGDGSGIGDEFDNRTARQDAQPRYDREPQQRYEQQPRYERDRNPRNDRDDEPRRETAERATNGGGQGDESEQRPRAERPRRDDRPQRAPRPRQDRDDDAPATLSADMLPPAIAITSAAEAVEEGTTESTPAPRKRGRPRKVVAEAVVEG